MTEPKPASQAAIDHADSFAVGDAVDYQGAALGSLRGVIAKVLDLADSSGNRLKTFLVRIEGYVEHITTSADALTKVEKATPQSIEIPRSAYTDTTVPPVVDARAAEEPGASGGGFDEPQSAASTTGYAQGGPIAAGVTVATNSTGEPEPITPTNTNQGA